MPKVLEYLPHFSPKPRRIPNGFAVDVILCTAVGLAAGAVSAHLGLDWLILLHNGL